MSELSTAQMEAAIYTRSIDADPDFDDPKDAVNQQVYEDCGTVQEWQAYQYASKEEAAQAIRRRRHELWTKYETGQQVLEDYKLVMSRSRVTVPYAVDGSLNPQFGNDYDHALIVDSGHIATSPAYRLAKFTQRTS